MDFVFHLRRQFIMMTPQENCHDINTGRLEDIVMMVICHHRETDGVAQKSECGEIFGKSNTKKQTG